MEFKSLNLLFLIFSLMYLLMSSILLISQSPLIVGSLIIIQAFTLSMYMNILIEFSWFSYLIFLIYVGGILMIFSYIISMTSQSEIFLSFNTPFSKFKLVMNFFLITWMIETMKKKMNFEKMFFKKLKIEEVTFTISSSSIFFITIILILFLLITLIIVVLISEPGKANFRSF